ncbi:MAG: sugar ABC transporter permease [Geminicoccaceae bacterium]
MATTIDRMSTTAGRIATGAGIDPRILAMMGVMLAIWVVLDLLTGGIFLTARNLFNLSLQVAVVGIMASGMVLVIVARHIDLSVGSQLGFIGVFGALMQTSWLTLDGTGTWWLTVIAMLALGVLIGALQGALVASARIPSFVVTLGGLLFFRNAAYQLNDGKTVAPLDPTFQLLGGGLNGTLGGTWSWIVGLLAVAAIAITVIRTRLRRARFGFETRPITTDVLVIAIWSAVVLGFVAMMNAYKRPGTEEPMGIAIPVIILAGVTLAMTVFATRHRFGRHVYAVGGNPESADLAGIDTRKVTIKIFALMGLLCGLAAIVISARLNAGAAATGTMTELNVIAAAVIGGTSLAGGIGTIYGAVIGAIVMQSLESGMVLLGVPSPMQKMVLAIVLIVAVWVDMAWRRRARA